MSMQIRQPDGSMVDFIDGGDVDLDVAEVYSADGTRLTNETVQQWADEYEAAALAAEAARGVNPVEADAWRASLSDVEDTGERHTLVIVVGPEGTVDADEAPVTLWPSLFPGDVVREAEGKKTRG